MCTACWDGYGVSGTICVPCDSSLTNCVKCSTNYMQCSYCAYGYALVSGTCLPAIGNCGDPHCVYCPFDINYCLQCDGFYGADPSGNCQSMTQSGCSNCSTNYAGCDQCVATMGVTPLRQCTVCAIAGCTDCSHNYL